MSTLFYRAIILILLVRLLGACSEETTEVPISIEIDIDIKEASSLSDAELFKSIEIIPLGFTKEAYVQRINKCIQLDDNYYLLNSFESGESVIILDTQGNVVNTLNKKGRGPGEYLKISDMEIDPMTKDIWIFDGYMMQVQIYDENLNYRKTLELEKGKRASLLCSNPKNNTFGYIQSKNKSNQMDTARVFVTENDGRLLNEFVFDIPAEKSSYGGIYRLHSFGDYFSYLPKLSNDIYYFNADTCFKAVKMNFTQPSLEEYKKSGFLEGVIYNRAKTENEKGILIRFIYNNDSFLGWYNKQKKTFKLALNPSKNSGRGRIFNVVGKTDKDLILYSPGCDIQEILMNIDPENKLLKNPEIIDAKQLLDNDNNGYLLLISMK